MNNPILHQSEIDVISRQTENHQQIEQSPYILKPNQKVYLYGDTSFVGTLIRPLERTYPPTLARSFADETSAGSLGWTVQLDRGGYDSATVSEITPINPQDIKTETAIPFDDSSETVSPHHEQVQLEEDNEVLDKEQEILILKTQLKQLQQENEILNTGVEYAS